MIDANGHKQTDSATVSDAFNQYFSEVGSRLASKIPPTSKSPTASVPSKPGVGNYFTQRARFGKIVEAAGRTLIGKQGEDLFFLEITVHVRM